MKIMKLFFLLLLFVLAGCSNNQRAENESGGGEATITINGELYAVEVVRCGTGPEDYRITADGPEYSFVQVRFPDWRDPNFDNGRLVYYSGDKELGLDTRDFSSRGSRDSDEVEVTGSENHAVGNGIVYESPFQADRGASFVIEIDIRCPD